MTVLSCMQNLLERLHHNTGGAEAAGMICSVRPADAHGRNSFLIEAHQKQISPRLWNTHTHTHTHTHGLTTIRNCCCTCR
jgi:hypothetical protein